MTDRSTRRPDEGFALIEVLMAVAIMSISFVAILSGLGTSVHSSELHRTSADANAALTSAAETVKAAPFTACGSAVATYRDFLRANTPLPGGWSTDDLDVLDVTCPTNTSEMVTVRVLGPGTDVATTLTVAKAERPSTLPIPVTTTTTMPGPPPASACRVSDARGFRFGSLVLVVVIANPNQPSCTWPLRARLSESTGSTTLIRLGWVWLNLVPAGSQCDDGSCSWVLLDGSGLTITTRTVIQ
jgi:prepilin-type N-terminal cleavage/methylation domain-containing protein